MSTTRNSVSTFHISLNKSYRKEEGELAMKTMTISIVAILILGLCSVVMAETVMIVNTANPQTSITKGQISNIFLGSATKWSNGQKAAPVDQPKSTAPGKAFLANIVGMSEADYKKLWVEKMLSGQAEPMPVKPTDDDVIKFVKDNPGAVGYIDSANLKADSGVKAIAIDGKTNW